MLYYIFLKLIRFNYLKQNSNMDEGNRIRDRIKMKHLPRYFTCTKATKLCPNLFSVYWFYFTQNHWVVKMKVKSLLKQEPENCLQFVNFINNLATFTKKTCPFCSGIIMRE